MDRSQSDILAAQYIAKWNLNNPNDGRLTYFYDKFYDWLQQIPKDVQPIVLKLLDNFCYYSHAKANCLLQSLHKNLIKDYNITEDDTIYTFIKSKNGKSNSSNDYWTEYKGINSLNTEICIIDISEINKGQWGGIKNIVIIDDCCGTGKTFIDYIEKNMDRFIGKNIYFVSLHIMYEAKENIDKFATEHKLHIFLINAKVQHKAFTANYFESDSDEAEQSIIQVSENIGVPKDYILGFKKSESLMGFYNNTPNNTLGILWHDSAPYFSIFPRKVNAKPSWRNFQKNKQERQTKNYNAIARGNDSE